MLAPMAFPRDPVRLILAAVLLALAWAAPAAAHSAKEMAYAPTCHATSAPARDLAKMAPRAAWTCDGAPTHRSPPVAWLRFEAEAWADGAPPRFFYSRTARHEAITLAVLDADGRMVSRRFAESEGTPIGAGPVFTLPLPEVTPQTRAVIVRIDKPHSIPLLTEARLADHPEAVARSQVEIMLLALVLGMLVLPLLFDITFYLVLRERFVIYHALLVTGMIGYVLFAGGLINVFVALPVPLLAVLAPLCWALSSGAALLFLSAFLEAGALAPRVRRLIYWWGWFSILVPGFFTLQFEATQSFDDLAYFLTITPGAAVTLFAIAHAIRRGSRSAIFVAIAWVPMIAAALERVVRGLGLYAGPASLDTMMFVAAGIEVVVISLAIADRFLAIRRERDAAVSEARMLEQLSTRDALTGLMNRRAIEARFDELLAQGFDTFALVDLDRFKAINDLHGHQVGDAALIACAGALRSGSDRDSIAVRLGGEEFVVLLRGPRTLERAEALRRAIPMRIAQEVPGLEMPVTASMGVVMLGDAARHKMAFAEFYARADALMYEAKASGRNRLAYERLTVFSPQPERRRGERAA